MHVLKYYVTIKFETNSTWALWKDKTVSQITQTDKQQTEKTQSINQSTSVRGNWRTEEESMQWITCMKSRGHKGKNEIEWAKWQRVCILL